MSTGGDSLPTLERFAGSWSVCRRGGSVAAAVPVAAHVDGESVLFEWGRDQGQAVTLRGRLEAGALVWQWWFGDGQDAEAGAREANVTLASENALLVYPSGFANLEVWELSR